MMFEAIKRFFQQGKSDDQLERDKFGRPVANRTGVDTKPNEPFDSKAPPIRYESEEEVREMKKSLE